MIDIGAWSMAVKLVVAWFLSRTEIISILGQSMFFPKGFIHKFQIFLSFRVGILENFFQIRHWPHLRFQLKCLKKTWDAENFKNILPVFCPFWRLIFVSSFCNWILKKCAFSLFGFEFEFWKILFWSRIEIARFWLERHESEYDSSPPRPPFSNPLFTPGVKINIIMKLQSDSFCYIVGLICGWGSLYATPFEFFPYWREVVILFLALYGMACKNRETVKNGSRKIKKQVKKRVMKRGKYYVN